jgi:exodeoxyribonuclease VII small subunit
MAKKEFSFTDAVGEIEKILQKIESGDLDVDKLAVEVKRASELIRQCQKKLHNTEEEINSIFKDLV